MSITPWPASRDYNGNTWAPKGLGSPIPLALISGAHTAHLFRPLHLCADFPNGNPIALASPSSWGLTWNLSFTFTPPTHNPLRNSIQGSSILLPKAWPPDTFWNLGSSFYDLVTLAFSMTSKAACRWCFQVWLPDAAWPQLTTFTEASGCLSLAKHFPRRLFSSRKALK